MRTAPGCCATALPVALAFQFVMRAATFLLGLLFVLSVTSVLLALGAEATVEAAGNAGDADTHVEAPKQTPPPAAPKQEAPKAAPKQEAPKAAPKQETPKAPSSNDAATVDTAAEGKTYIDEVVSQFPCCLKVVPKAIGVIVNVAMNRPDTFFGILLGVVLSLGMTVHRLDQVYQRW